MRKIPARKIGRTPLEVTELGFGGTGLGNIYTHMAEAQAQAAIRTVYDAGVRHFDTAPLYGHGLSEHRLGHGLRGLPRSTFVLSTKVGRLLVPSRKAQVESGLFVDVPPFQGVIDYGYDAAFRCLEDSLHRLGTNRVDLLYIHDVDRRNHGDDYPKRFREAMEGSCRALERMRSDGTVAAIGVGVNEWQPCVDFARAGDFDCFLLAGRYTLLEQDALDALFPLCEKKNISIIIGGPFNSGILATGPVPGAMYNYAPAPPGVLGRVERIQRVCQRHDVALAAAALQFPLAHPIVASVISGGGSVQEVKDNLACFSQPIPAALWQDLQAEGLVRKDAPVPA